MTVAILPSPATRKIPATMPKLAKAEGSERTCEGSGFVSVHDKSGGKGHVHLARLSQPTSVPQLSTTPSSCI